MYHSPVPLIIIHSDVHSMIEVNGQLLGECFPGSQVVIPAGDTGDYYISAQPLSDEPRWSVTRKLSFEDGVLSGSLADDVRLCAWPGGVYELFLETGHMAFFRSMEIPHTIDTLSFSIGKQRRTLTLYSENGLRLLVEDGGHTRTGISLGHGAGGSLALYAAGGTQFAAIRTVSSAGQKLLILDSALQSALEINAEEILLEEDCICAVTSLGTLMGHQQRVRYVFENDVFSSGATETGFFTRSYTFPKDNRELTTAFCEAVREGFEDEAFSYLTEELHRTMNFADLRDFLGNFSCCRPPLSDQSGALLGLIACESDRISSARLYEFSFENGRISDISEV